MITKTIGGDRVGSGKKMQAHLHNYNRSTHNLSQKWASSMGSGILYPALCIQAMRGDSFDIDLAADCRTIPTVGPLFGSYKMQIDVYQCPVRLYQGILHNNPLAIGLNMAQVKFPKLKVMTKWTKDDYESGKFSESSLLTYLGMRGLGQSANNNADNTFGRDINAIPALAYYDIFKTYYANKQEEAGYVITQTTVNEEYGINAVYGWTSSQWRQIQNYDSSSNYWYISADTKARRRFKIEATHLYYLWLLKQYSDLIVLDEEGSVFNIGQISGATVEDPLTTSTGTKIYTEEINLAENYWIIIIDSTDDTAIEFTEQYGFYKIEDERTVKKPLGLQPFELTNIDNMRYDLLSHNQLGTTFYIQNDGNEYLPYSVLVDKDSDGKTLNAQPLNGLCLKTYQNDIFNNWLNTEWIEGENGINEMSKVAIVNGAFSMDSLNFATKLYNMLNRIAIAGATYEDWQDVVYEEVQRRQIESPIFIGGMSQEVVFDEIVQTSPGEYEGEQSTLGTLGGRGRILGETRKGGKMHVKCDEACFIIAIVSLTPRIYQTQGNEFYMTDIDSMNDLHKPPMDGIGFQDLIGERLAWWDTVVAPNGTNLVHRSKVGKLPAWIEYMTAVDKAYGDFANENASYMILNRHYEMDEETHRIKDATTYIDPEKYNYAFAVKKLEAQNFWVQVNFNIIARRLMSARLIPNV